MTVLLWTPQSVCPLSAPLPATASHTGDGGTIGLCLASQFHLQWSCRVTTGPPLLLPPTDTLVLTALCKQTKRRKHFCSKNCLSSTSVRALPNRSSKQKPPLPAQPDQPAPLSSWFTLFPCPSADLRTPPKSACTPSTPDLECGLPGPPHPKPLPP